MSEDQRHCPGERYTISDAVCRGRRSRHYPKCKGCVFNDDEVAGGSPQDAGSGGIADGIFKAYDIRGKVPSEVNEDVAWRIGFATAQHLLSRDDVRAAQGEYAKAVIVGHDMRPSSESLSKACIEGILATGADCVAVGEIETPAIYYAVGSLQAAGGIMITASHNPVDYNGFKITAAGVKPVGGESGLKDIQRIAQDIEEAGGPLKGRLVQRDISSGYILHVRRFTGQIKPMRIVMDASNGMASKWTPSILRDLSIDVVPLYFERSGRFVHEPNPLRDENIADLKQRVVEVQARLGVCFDGDADRCVVVDENGDRVGGDTLTALLAREFLKAEHGVSIIYDLRSSWVVREEIERLGGVPRRERVGHSFMKATLRRYNAPFGGELSGHFYFRDNFYCDSAIITFVRLLSVLSQSTAPFSEILEPLRKYATSGEVNFHVDDKDRMIKELARKFADGKVDFLDGVTVEYQDWWFNCRKSNTEPLLRLIVEARDAETLEDRMAVLQAMLGEPANE